MIYFYARRILRIWPVYFLAIIASFLLMKLQLAHLPFQIIIHSDSLPWYLGFIANFYIISHSETSVVVSVLWSISTEEQFYFIWPLIVSYIKKKHIPLILCLIIISATLFRFLNADSYKVVSYSTFSVMSDLAMGALFGFFAFHDLSFSQRISAFFTKGKVIALYLILAISLYIKMLGPSLIPSSFYRLYIAILPVIFSILFILIIIEQNYSSASLFKVGKSKVLTYLGKISYGLYAYHAIAIAIVFSCLVTWGITSKVIITLASFAFAILIAHLSYKYIELKVLRFKKRVQ